ncbi:MAG: ABC transporter substrate-binding protein [Burkholderiales bacterium]|nr:ABC transporter substrate-binding protein [Burkholderiales bacterium]
MSTIAAGTTATNAGSAANRAPGTLWYTRCPVPTASGIAIQNGWLQDEFGRDGIAVRSLRHSPDAKVRESHYTHTLEDSFRQGGNAPAIFARSEGKDTVLLGLHWVRQYLAVITLPDSGLTRLEELRGKRLALPRRVNDKIDFWRATTLQAYGNALRRVGLGLDDVELVDLPVHRSYVDEDVAITQELTPAPRLIKYHTSEMSALIRGDVDAMFAFSVWGAAVRSQLGATQLVDLASEAADFQVNNEFPVTLTVSGRLLREHPDLVLRYLVQLVRAADWASHHPDPVRRAVAIETGCAEYWLDQGVGEDVGRRLAMSFDEPLVSALETRKRFMLEHGFIRRDFDIREWMNPEPLRHAKRRAAELAPA